MATYERKRPLSDAEILRQANEARALQREMRVEGLVAVDARYDAPSRRVLIEMSGGLLVGVPVGAIAALADASDAQLGLDLRFDVQRLRLVGRTALNEPARSNNSGERLYPSTLGVSQFCYR